MSLDRWPDLEKIPLVSIYFESGPIQPPISHRFQLFKKLKIAQKLLK